MKALVLFGSKSDKDVYEPLVKELEKKYEVEFQVLSAHRDPEGLRDKMLKDDFDFIVAGAGLAAHLPGVAAALTEKPVFGIAVDTQFSGLDAVMAISQMPYGIPVACLPPGENKALFEFLDMISLLNKSKIKTIQVLIEKNLLNYEYVNKELNRFKVLASELNFELIFNPEKIDEELFSFVFVHEESDIDNSSGDIHIPLLDDNIRKQTRTGLTIHNWIEKGGLWVGVNNSRNALLFLNKWK